MIDERFGIAMTLVRRELEDLDLGLGSLGVRAAELGTTLATARRRLNEGEKGREASAQARHTAEVTRTDVERRLADGKVEIGRLEGDLALAAERLHNAGQRRAKAGQDRTEAEIRAGQAAREREAAAAEQTAAEQDQAGVQAELEQRTAREEEVRSQLFQRQAARAAHAHASSLRMRGIPRISP